MANRKHQTLNGRTQVSRPRPVWTQLTLPAFLSPAIITDAAPRRGPCLLAHVPPPTRDLEAKPHDS